MVNVVETVPSQQTEDRNECNKGFVFKFISGDRAETGFGSSPGLSLVDMLCGKACQPIYLDDVHYVTQDHFRMNNDITHRRRVNALRCRWQRQEGADGGYVILSSREKL